jgi:hypothetical protein
VLADVPISIAYTTRYRRSAQTVAPLCEARGVQTWAVEPAAGLDLASRLRKRMGQTVLVCGDSYTIPALMKDLGVKEKVAIGDDEYDRLFVVTLDSDGVRLLSLRYAVEPPTLERERGK